MSFPCHRCDTEKESFHLCPTLLRMESPPNRVCSDDFFHLSTDFKILSGHPSFNYHIQPHATCTMASLHGTLPYLHMPDPSWTATSRNTTSLDEPLMKTALKTPTTTSLPLFSPFNRTSPLNSHPSAPQYFNTQHVRQQYSWTKWRRALIALVFSVLLFFGTNLG
jgi:hypothetical protein